MPYDSHLLSLFWNAWCKQIVVSCQMIHLSACNSSSFLIPFHVVELTVWKISLCLDNMYTEKRSRQQQGIYNFFLSFFLVTHLFVVMIFLLCSVCVPMIFLQFRTGWKKKKVKRAFGNKPLIELNPLHLFLLCLLIPDTHSFFFFFCIIIL